MPRHSLPENEPYLLDMVDIAYLKTYSTDLLYDFKIVYREFLNQFSEYLSLKDQLEMERHIQKLSALKFKPLAKTRVYIITGSLYVCLALFGMDECVVDNLAYTYDLCNSDVPNPGNPPFTSVLYIFKGNDLVSSNYLSAAQMAKLMAVFHKENLVDFSGARYDLYGKPRRAEKSRTDY